MLLTLAETQALRGAPGDLVEVPLGPANENPDPRLPCGRKPTQQPASTDAAMVAFHAETTVDEVWVTHVVYGLAPGHAERHLAESRANMRPGCPAFASQTPTGNPQTTEFLGGVPLPPLGDDRLATSHRIRASDGAIGYSMSAMIRSGNTLAWVGVLGLAPVSQEFFTGVATAAAKKLA